MQLNLNGVDYEVRDFRDSAHGLESINGFVDECVLPILRDIDLISTIRCTLSGLPIAISTFDEIKDCVAASIKNTGLNKVDNLLSSFTTAEISSGIEMMVDEVIGQMLTSWRRSPSMTLARNGTVISALAPQKQLATLLNLFLFDGGMFRRPFKSIEDDRSVKVRIAAMADMILNNWDAQPGLEDLLDALIELDAKYRITKLKLLRKERDALEAMTFDSLVDVLNLTAFVNKMTAWRDDPAHDITLYVGERSWTQEAMRLRNINMGLRRRFSNVIVDEELILVEGQWVKKAKSVEGQVKQAQKNNRASILRSIFGNNAMGA